MSIVVTSDNFGLVAAKFYEDISATDQEFQDDLRRFSLIKRLFNSYLRTGELKERLILNHLIVIFNVFDRAAVPLLFHELRDYLTLLVPFLVALNRLPEQVNGIYTTTIVLDPKVVECLRQNFRG
jgi:hypothetical protein